MSWLTGYEVTAAHRHPDRNRLRFHIMSHKQLNNHFILHKAEISVHVQEIKSSCCTSTNPEK